jgi:hypothetical protein
MAILCNKRLSSGATVGIRFDGPSPEDQWNRFKTRNSFAVSGRSETSVIPEIAE